MAWFGSVRSFHSSALNSFARALAKLSDVPTEKVGVQSRKPHENYFMCTSKSQIEKLFEYCPSVFEKKERCVLHDRGLSAVVALGLFAVDSKLKVCFKRVALSRSLCRP